MVIDGAQERMLRSFQVTEQEQRLALAVQTARLRLLAKMMPP